MSPRSPWRARVRRAFARISITVQCGLSSISSGAAPSRPTAWLTFCQSPSGMRPVHRLRASTRASAARSRLVSSRLPISSEKKRTGRFASSATERAAPRANAVFPALGLAATITRFEGCSPSSIESRSVYPVGTPVTSVTPYMLSSWSRVACSASEIVMSDALWRRSATSNTSDSARSRVSGTSSGAS